MQVSSYAEMVDAAITSISGVLNADAETVMVYTISGRGQAMKKADIKLLPKGIYIVDGQKVVVK